MVSKKHIRFEFRLKHAPSTAGRGLARVTVAAADGAGNDTPRL